MAKLRHHETFEPLYRKMGSINLVWRIVNDLVSMIFSLRYIEGTLFLYDNVARLRYFIEENLVGE